MAHQISGHLSNAAILALAAVIAVAANQFTAAPPAVTVGVARVGISGGDISGFIAPQAVSSMVPPFRLPIRVDPFELTEPVHETAVASRPGNAVSEVHRRKREPVAAGARSGTGDGAGRTLD